MVAEASLEEINNQLGENSFKIAVIDLSEVEYLEKNARYMTNETFNNLVQNIKRDRGLSSVPFCWKNGDKYRALSGNHRLKAAQAAGLEKVLVMYTDAPLNKQDQVSIHLPQ